MSDTKSKRYTAENQGEEYTSKNPSRSRIGPHVGELVMKLRTLIGSTPRCGYTEPGTLAKANKKSRTSAVFMLVSWRHNQRKNPLLLIGGKFVIAPSRIQE